MKTEYEITITTYNNDLSLKTIKLTANLTLSTLKSLISDLTRNFRQAEIMNNETGEVILTHYMSDEVFSSVMGEKWGLGEVLVKIWDD